MKVPYAKKWQEETDKLRQIALDCGLTEELKWGKPCFTFLKKNVAIVIPLKESCAFSFFKGALLKDPKHVLERIGEHTQAGRWIKFTSLREIAAVRSTLKDYLYEAIELEESGTKIDLKKPSEYPIPEELQRRLDDNAVLRSAFATLTPGRRKSYIFHVSAARGIFHDLAPDAPVKFSSFDDEMGGWLADRRFLLLLVGLFAAAALALAAVGIYGVVAFSVTRRTQEIGIRMALGAERADVLRLVVGEGARLAVSGVAIGIAASFAITRLLSSLLFGVSATDPITFAGVAVLLSIVALLASYIPARRAMRLDPTNALRYE